MTEETKETIEEQPESTDDAGQRPAVPGDGDDDAGERPTVAAGGAMRTIIIAIVTAAVGLGIGLWLGTDDAPPETSEQVEAEGSDEATTYTCSMHPQIRSEEMGQCPICGMDLIPVASDGSGTDDASPARVTLSDRAKKLAEIRTTPVRRLGDETREIRLLGRVDEDETRVRTVTSWTGGRIDRLRVATTGEKVRAGQTIATIYSPEIYAAHRDLIQAKRQLASLQTSMEFARNSAEATLQSARQKLRLLGVSNQEIARMEESDEPWTQISIRTRFGGTVTELLVNEGSYVDAGSGLYRVADLSRLWVQLDAYESDLPRLRVGQHVDLQVEALPDRTFDGTIAFIDPIVDPTKRTSRVRVEVSNEEGLLRPGMFVEAVVHGGTQPGEALPLVIPSSAPLFSGRRSIVYVEVPNTDRPTYAARSVKLGARAGDVYPVVSGLSFGERVVVHGAFAIDADLQIKGGESLMMRPDDESRGEETMIEVDGEFRSGLAPIVDHYLTIQAALADDELEPARTAAKNLSDAASRFEPENPAQAAEVWIGLREELSRHAQHMAQARGIDGAREAFDGFSKVLAKLLARFGNPTGKDLKLAYCPMAFENRGAEWIQLTDEVDNSYFGSDMLRCGEIRHEIPAGQYLNEPSAGAESAPAAGHEGHDHE